MEMRPARLDDVDAVTDYYFRSWQVNLAHLFPPGALDSLPSTDVAARRATFMNWFGESSSHRTVVVADPGPVGHVTVSGDELVHLFIDPDAQGGGIGRRLLAEGERIIAADHRRARLMTLVGNDRAVVFYSKHGWELSGHTVASSYLGHDQVEQELTKSL